MDKSWFEMSDCKQRTYNKAVWIPLYACDQIEETGEYGCDGYKSEFFGCGTLAIPLSMKENASSLGWDDIGIGNDTSIWIDDSGIYIPAEKCIFEQDNSLIEGVRLVLRQDTEDPGPCELYLNQDFIFALGLKRENDIWLCPSEGYIDVAHVKRNTIGKPILFEVRAEFLKDYLCARKMALRTSIYRERRMVTKLKPSFSLSSHQVPEGLESDRWQGFINEIHEGGEPFGAKVFVMHVARTDVDFQADVPEMGVETDDNTNSHSMTRGFSGELCYRISGEMWREEWIEPADLSPRVARDEMPATVYFITNAEGKRENKTTLDNDGRWLWFKPSIVSDIIERRGGNLEWYTAQTGSLNYLQSMRLHFGVNSLGLINVYAKDIARLPLWLQQIWSGYNVAPDGKVSSELLAAQVKAEPADTQAPEPYLSISLRRINEISTAKFKFLIFKDHDAIPGILKQCHRFRAIDQPGLYALAKDLARVIADSINLGKIQEMVNPPKGEKWGSIKTLEHFLSAKVGPEIGREVTGPLVAIYNMRLADAHLPSDKVDDVVKILDLDEKEPFIHQGYQMLHMCVSCLATIECILKKW